MICNPNKDHSGCNPIVMSNKITNHSNSWICIKISVHRKRGLTQLMLEDFQKICKHEGTKFGAEVHLRCGKPPHTVEYTFPPPKSHQIWPFLCWWGQLLRFKHPDMSSGFSWMLQKTDLFYFNVKSCAFPGLSWW